MTTKATDSVLNLVSPPISNMVLSQGTLNNTTIGVTVPNVGYFTENHATRQFINGVELIMLNANTTFYVAPGGTDIPTNGLTALTPWRTRQYAYSILQNHYHLAGWIATIQLADGVYNDSCFLSGRIAGQWSPQAVIFQGNLANPAACHLDTTAFATGGVGFATNDCSFWARGFKFSATSGTLIASGNAFFVSEQSNVYMDTCTFANCSNAHLSVFFGGAMFVRDYTVTGSALSHVFGTDGGFVYFYPTTIASTVTLVGLPVYPNGFVQLGSLAFVRATSIESSFVGNALGPRYSIQSNSVINTFFGGANFFPGDSPGTTFTGAQYV